MSLLKVEWYPPCRWTAPSAEGHLGFSALAAVNLGVHRADFLGPVRPHREQAARGVLWVGSAHWPGRGDRAWCQRGPGAPASPTTGLPAATAVHPATALCTLGT